ncbi:hypothetical protein BGX29_011671, partial [Mortierella sp. GBA35]
PRSPILPTRRPIQRDSYDSPTPFFLLPFATQQRYQQYQQPRGLSSTSFRNMEVKTELMRRAIRFCSPAIGLNYFDYSTGQRRYTLLSSSSPSSSSSAQTLNPYIRSLGYDTGGDPTTRSSGYEDSLDAYSVIGIKHGAWSTGLAQVGADATRGGYNCSTSSRDDRHGMVDWDKEDMLCLQSSDSEGATTTTMKMKHVLDVTQSKVHQHRILQQYHQNRQGQGPGLPCRFTRYCCVHHTLHRGQDHHQDKEESIGQGNGNGSGPSGTGTGTETRTGNNDWWIEYRSVPVDAPVCLSCARHQGVQQTIKEVELEAEVVVGCGWRLDSFVCHSIGYFLGV